MPTTFTKKGALNQKGGSRKDSKNIQKLLESLRDHHLKDVLDNLLLRAMKQARYSADNLGHYGLSSMAYSHFTSPIRRYPDLVIHREIKKYCKGGEFYGKNLKKIDVQAQESLHAELEDVAVHTSNNERRAVDLERKILSLYSVWFVKDKIGLESTAQVSSCTDFGVFVRLDEPDVEGLIHISKLGNDFFKYVPEQMRLIGERSGVQIGVGDRLRVAIVEVDLQKYQIFLSCLEITEQKGEQCSITLDKKNSAEGSDDSRKSMYERKRAEFMNKGSRGNHRNSSSKNRRNKRDDSDRKGGSKSRKKKPKKNKLPKASLGTHSKSRDEIDQKKNKRRKKRKPSQKRSFR